MTGSRTVSKASSTARTRSGPWCRLLVALGVGLLSACGTDKGVLIKADPASPSRGSPAAPPSNVSSNSSTAGSIALAGNGPKLAAGNTGASTVNGTSSGKNLTPALASIRPDAQCAGPAESYDFVGVLTARYGAEGALRFQALMSSDFKSDKLNAKDKALLRTLAREMLWIPASVEDQLGRLMLEAGGQQLKHLSRSPVNEEIWVRTTSALSQLLNAAPKSPFDTRLMIVENGDPGSLAGGYIFIDKPMAEAAADQVKPHSPEQQRLQFVMAHELAHVYKRHRAKRIQQLIVDSEAGLKIVRALYSSSSKSANKNQPNGLGLWLPLSFQVYELAQQMRKHHAKYEQDQEFEADSCATALLLQSGQVDPLEGFRAFRAYATAQGHESTLANEADPFASHPPNAAREDNIKVKLSQAGLFIPPNEATAAGQKDRAKTSSKRKSGEVRSPSPTQKPKAQNSN